MAVIACGCRARPEGPVDTVAGLLHEERETLILYLGNESDERDWIDIEVAIDEKEIVKDRLRSYHDDLRMPRPHKEHRLALEPGEHVLTAKSNAGKAETTQQFKNETKHWAALDFWYSSSPKGSGPVPAHFSFVIRGEPIGFE